jgi:hypothetical protein
MAFHHGPRVEIATGGSISTISGYTVHTFSNVGVDTFIPTTTGNIEVLVVGAGGSASPAGASGGGSAVYHKFMPVIAGVAYTVSVGSASTLFHPTLTLTAPAGGDGETNNPLGSSGGFSGPEGIQTDSVNQITYGFAGARGDIIRADGGTVTVDGVYNVHTFRSGGIFTCTAGPGLMDYLLVGSGGGAGQGDRGAGGGGGGSVIYTANAPFLTSFRTGISSELTLTSAGPRLGNTYNFRDVVAPGGGEGAEYRPTYPPGIPRDPAQSNPLGSGGGGSWDRQTGGVGAGVTGLGFPGGNATNTTGNPGGGARSAGPAGQGVVYSITGTSSLYGAGGRPQSNLGPRTQPQPVANIGQGGGPGWPAQSWWMSPGPGALIVRYYADGKKGGGGGSAGAAVTTMGGAGSIYKIDGTSRSYGGGGGDTLHPTSSPTDYGLGTYSGTGNPGIVIIRYLS